MNNILLTTDFSNNSIHAMHYASALFMYKPCKFYVLHVVKASSFISDDLVKMEPRESLYHELVEEKKEKIQAIISTIENRTNNILHEYIPIVDYDNFIEAINQVVAMHSIDLIIMGTKGVTNLEALIFGSNTLRVFQRTNTAVMAIPEETPIKPFKQVLFTSKYQEEYEGEDLSVLIDLAEHYNYNIDVLHLMESRLLTSEEENIKQLLVDKFKNINHRFVYLNKGDFLKTVMDYIEKNKVSLFVMTRKKHTFLEHLFLKHKTKEIANNLKIPFLILPKRNT